MLKTTTVRIRVTEEHRRTGVQRYAFGCPVALAVREHIVGGEESIAVTPSEVVFNIPDFAVLQNDGRRNFSARLPCEVGLGICHFDTTGKMPPMWFDLEIPTILLKQQPVAAPVVEKEELALV